MQAHYKNLLSYAKLLSKCESYSRKESGRLAQTCQRGAQSYTVVKNSPGKHKKKYFVLKHFYKFLRDTLNINKNIF